MVTTTETITMTYGPFEEDVYIAGMPSFHIAVTPTPPTVPTATSK